MHNWKAIILKPTDTTEKAIEVLNEQGLRVVMVSDEKGKLLGTVTDGDIRRSLLQHQGLETQIVEIMSKSPTTALASDTDEKILAMMKSKDLLQVPILDENRTIVGLETFQHLLEGKKRDNPVFLMAGGFGKRLRPMTDNTPKPLLKVGNKPILETILQQFIDFGFHNFYISTHYKAEKVREYFGDGSSWGVKINYVHEDEPLGTAGALGLLPAYDFKLPILMMNGDLLTKINFESLLNFHAGHTGIATMCVRKYEIQVPYGVIEAEEHKVMSIIEKPIHNFFINAGVYVIEPSLLQEVDGKSYLDMPTLLENQIQAGRQVNMFPLHEYWIDIGQLDEYERARDAFEDEFGIGDDKSNR